MICDVETVADSQTSTTYDTFMYMSLPVPSNKKAVVVQELIDEFIRVEYMDGEDAWYASTFLILLIPTLHPHSSDSAADGQALPPL